MQENEIYQIADKVSEALQRFYSIHDADELTRVITDPTKGVEDVRACMNAIQERNRMEAKADSAEVKLPQSITLKTEEDLVTALKEKYPEGLDIHLDGLTADDIFAYIGFGDLQEWGPSLLPLGKEQQNWDNMLTNTYHLTPEQYGQLMPVTDGTYYDRLVEVLVESKENEKQYDEATTVLLNRTPDLNGAQLDLSGQRMRYGWRIEGESLDSVVSIMLQEPDMDTESLKGLLNSPAKMAEFQASLQKVQEQPSELRMKKNPNFLYFYRPGILGHARIDRERGVTFSGQPFPKEDWKRIMEVAKNRNLPYTNDRQTFFRNVSPKTEARLYMNTREDRAVVIHLEKNLEGKVMHTSFGEMVKDMDRMQDITGRLTEATVITPVSGKPFVRCKIDGVQQSGSTLTRNDIIKMGHFSHTPEEQKLFALNMAVKHFAGELLDREQSRGMHR